MYKVRMNVDTQNGKDTLHIGDTINVDDITAERWRDNGVADVVEKLETLEVMEIGVAKPLDAKSIADDIKEEIIEPVKAIYEEQAKESDEKIKELEGKIQEYEDELKKVKEEAEKSKTNPDDKKGDGKGKK